MWQIKETGFNKENIIHHGNQFLIGHLKLGIRGTMDEYTKNELVAINLPLVYDQVGDLWREPVNAFNPLYTRIKVDGLDVNLLACEPISHLQQLNLKDASMYRKTTFMVNKKEVTIESLRFVSSLHDRLIVGTYKVTINQPALLAIETGIDADIWDINGPHIKNTTFKGTKIDLRVSGQTVEKDHQIDVYKSVKCIFEPDAATTEVVDQKLVNTYLVKSDKDSVYEFHQFAYIGVDEKSDEIKQVLQQAVDAGFDELYQRHAEVWYQKWQDADVLIEGDVAAQKALRYSIYHLLLLAPSNYHGASIPARGISGQTYKGAIFWDTEIFMLPFYLNTDLDSAKSIIDYRIATLPGAINKAKSYGFKGAFYAWESQEGGFDACTDYNVTDVFTNRKVRTYFKDKQIHISADIVYAIKSFIQRTNNYQILVDGGLEVVLEVARFYLDYGQYRVLDNRFELWDVMGPDEYHERVHNNAFTNQMVKMVFDFVVELEEKIESNVFNETVSKLDFKKELELIKDLSDRIFIRKPNEAGVIEQFDGYFDLRDIKKSELLKQKLHPNEYLGGTGLAGDTQIIKQADVITMMYLFKSLYSQELMKTNFDYYEPRTEHGSSLSASMYAAVACMIGKPEYAYPLFMKSATVDLTGESKQYAGGIYIGGTHPAASGGAYLTAIYGFAGLKFDEGIEVNPSLPDSIASITFKIKHQEKQYQVFVSKEKQEIKEI